MYLSCIAHVKDWIDTFISSAGDEDFAWYDMAVGQRASKLAYILRRAIDEEEKIEDIAAMIITADIHIQELMQKNKIAEHSNHGLFQMAGLLSLGKSLPFLENAERASKFAEKMIRKMLQSHFTSDFLHKEHLHD